MLSDEHILAFGLGGSMILKDASCRRCADVTSKIERHCLRGMFLPVRTHLKMPTRRPKERPKTLPVRFNDADDSQIHQVPVDHHPGYLFSFDLDPPQILYGLTDFNTVQTGRLVMRNVNTDTAERLQRLGPKVVLPAGFDVPTYARLLAKTAHAYAVAQCGIASFRPLLLDVILQDEARNIPRFVGGRVGMVPGTDRHRFSVEWQRVELRPVGWREYLVVSMSLFTDLDMPSYDVVVGKRV
jgi:hypothetical protein